MYVYGGTMTTLNITNLRNDIYKILEKTIKYNEVVNVTTKAGTAVIMSENDYNNLMETLYLTSIPEMEKKIREGLETPLEDCIDEGQVNW